MVKLKKFESFKPKFKETIVRFVSAKPYLNVSDEEFSKLFFCLHGRREVVVLCDDETIMKEIKNLPSEYFQPRLNDIKSYLTKNNIKFTEDFKNTTIV
jgi:hypothetical protein